MQSTAWEAAANGAAVCFAAGEMDESLLPALQGRHSPPFFIQAADLVVGERLGAAAFAGVCFDFQEEQAPRLPLAAYRRARVARAPAVDPSLRSRMTRRG